MKRAVLVSLLVAGVAGAEEPPAWLQPGAKPFEGAAEVARPRKPAAATLTPGGPRAGTAPAGELVTVVEASPDGKTVRAIVQNRVVRVAYYLDPAALATVARAGAVIVATTAPTAPQTGVRLRAGTPVVAELGGEGLVPASVEAGPIRARGFIAAGAAGKSYAVERGATEVEGERVEVKLPATFLDAPGGARLATFSGKGRHVATRLESRDGFVLVSLREDPAAILGWVRAASVVVPPPDKMYGRTISAGRIGIPGWPFYKGPAGGIAVPAGMLLSAAPEGPPVAVTVADATYAASGAGLSIPAPYGPLVLYLKR